jgi:quercetin dioxygenase-like cupin family protein
MKNLKNLLLAALMLLLMIAAAAAADEKGGQAMAPSPVVVSMAKFPITVAGGDYDLLTIIQDFPAGVGIGTHKHGGHVLVTVLSGEMTLREKGAERVIKTGESWTEHPGDIHAALNAGTVTSRVAISVVIPKGAEVTTMVK